MRQNTNKKCGNKEGKERKEKEIDKIWNTNSTKLNWSNEKKKSRYIKTKTINKAERERKSIIIKTKTKTALENLQLL